MSQVRPRSDSIDEVVPSPKRTRRGTADSAVVMLRGQCHCGRVQYQVPIATEGRLEAIECNCSICYMKGIKQAIVPVEKFVLLSGKDDLTSYTFNTHQARHTFCKHCGIHAFYHPRSHPEGVSINIRCITEPKNLPFRIVGFNGREWEREISKLRDSSKLPVLVDEEKVATSAEDSASAGAPASSETGEAATAD